MDYHLNMLLIFKNDKRKCYIKPRGDLMLGLENVLFSLMRSMTLISYLFDDSSDLSIWGFVRQPLL